jgi:putative heme iron utilization protein
MLLDLLRALAEVGGATFVVGTAEAIGELPGPRRVSSDGGWATLEGGEGCACHIHLHLDGLAEVRFVEGPGHGPGTKSFSVRFFRPAGELPAFAVYLAAEPYQALRDRFGGRDRIALTRADKLTS